VIPDHAGNERLDTLLLDHTVGTTSTGRTRLELTGMVAAEDTVNQRTFGLHTFGIVQLDGHSERAKTLFEAGSELGQMRGTNAALDGERSACGSLFTLASTCSILPLDGSLACCLATRISCSKRKAPNAPIATAMV
jgi:hypothetical protein